MEAKYVKSISTQVYRKFPEMKGVKPKVRAQTAGGSKYLLTFQTIVVLAMGKSMTRWVRVVASDQGEILKITTSK